MKLLKVIWVSLFLLLVACGGGEVETLPTRAREAPPISPPTATVVTIPTIMATARRTATPPPSPTPLPTTIPATATASGPCEIVAGTAVSVYQRPSREAGIFGTLDQAFRPVAIARTPDGAWIGFEPGVAQAANVGVFRLRWVADDDVRLEGGCSGLEVVAGPPAGVCFTMPMENVPVYVEADPESALVGELVPGEFAAVTARTESGWAQLDLDTGENALAGTGWVRGETLNVNGPCSELLPPAGE